MPGRTVTITALGETKDLEAAFRRAGLVVSESADEMAKSAQRAGAVAASAAKETGASLDEQVAASGRAAAAFVESQDAMSRAQKAAAAAAADTAKKAGQSADEQVAAAKRAADAQKAAADEQIAASKKVAESHRATEHAHATVSKVGGVVALGVAGAAVEAVKLGAAYQTAQASIQGATGQSVKSAGELTKAFGATAGSSMESGQQMEAAYAGVAGVLKLTEGHALSTAEAMKVSAAANSLAEGTGTDLASAYGAVAKTMQVFHMDASQAGEVSDTLYSTSKALGVPVEAVATGMAKLHARLGEVAPGMKDVAGLMVALGEHGLTGGRGVLVANTALTTLLGGSKKTDEVLKALGVSVYDSQGKFIGMQSVISQLQPKLAGLTQEQQRYAESTLFGKAGTEVMGQVIRAGAPAFDQATAAATRHGAALKAAEAQQKMFHGEMQTLKATVETLGGVFGLILIPEITLMGKALSDSIQWLEKHKAACIALGAVITGVLGTAVAVFAYDKSVKFVEGTKRMIDGLSNLVSSSSTTTAKIEADQAAQSAAVEANAGKTEAANATAGASFTYVGTEAAAGETATAGAVAGEAGAVTTADTTIEGANATAGASFMGLLGPIALVTAAAYGAVKVMEKVTGGHVSELLGGNQPGESGKEGEAYAKTHGYGVTQGSLGQSNQYPFVSQIAEKYGISPHTLWGIYGTETSYGSNITTSPTGAQGAFQFEPGTAKAYGYPLTNHPNSKQFEEQATAAARYIQANKQKYGSEAKAVEAYYAGHPGTPEGAEYRQTVEQKGGAHYGKAQEEEAKKAREQARHLQTVATHSNAALQEQMEEASGAKPKKGAKAKAEPYVEPFSATVGLRHERTDMGVDFAMQSGNIDAIGSGIVTAITKNWYKGQPLIEYQLTQGARKGQHVYVAEGIAPSVTVGEHLKAGQKIGTYQEHGTGLEMGFGAGGGKTLAQATTGYTEGQVTKAGQEFDKFIGSIGKGGTVLSQVTKAAEAFEKAEAKRLTTLETTAKRLLGEGTQHGNLQSAIQSGSVLQLEKILGVSTAGKTGANLSRELAGPLTQATLEHHIMPTLAKSAETTGTGRQYDKLIGELKSVHTAGANKMVTALEQAHKQALADLGRELYAVTQEKQAAVLQNQAAEEKDRTTQSANLASKQLQIAKDQATQVTDAMSASAQQIADATQIMKDSFSEMAEAVQLATQRMADAASGEVQHTQDQTAIKVAELGERGKYGLELVAQKLEVQLDQMKATYDVQIQQARMALDQAKISGQSLIAEKQQNMDLLQAHEDALVATAQAHTDAVQVSQDQAEATAQAQLDTVQLAADIRIDMAKQASVLVASGTKAQQDAAKGFEAYATSHGAKELAVAEAHVKAVEAAANQAIQAAQAVLAKAQGESAEAIANAQQALAQAEGSAHTAIANAERGLTSIEDTAKVAEAGLEGQVAITRAEAQTQYAGSGLVVNQYGMDFGNAQANANELTWALTHQLPV